MILVTWWIGFGCGSSGSQANEWPDEHGLDLVYVYSKTNSSHPCSKHTIGSIRLLFGCGKLEGGGGGRLWIGKLAVAIYGNLCCQPATHLLGVITLATLKLNEACIQYSVSQASEACMSVVLQISVQWNLLVLSWSVSKYAPPVELGFVVNNERSIYSTKIVFDH